MPRRTEHSDTTLNVSHSYGTESVPAIRDRWFAMVPAKVLADPNLEHIDVRVFAGLALGAVKPKHTAPKAVEMGLRRLGQLTGISKSEAGRSVNRLIAAGHLNRAIGQKQKARSRYEFVSSVFMLIETRDGGVVLQTGYSGVPKHVGTVPPSEKPVRMPKALRKAAS